MLRKLAPFSLASFSFASLSLALLLLGCGDKASGTDSEGEGTGSGTDGASTTVALPTSGATDAGATDGGATGGMSDGVSETGVPGSTTGPEPTTGGASPDLMSSCMDACAHIIECVPDLPGTVDDCMAGCLETWGGPDCGQAGLDLLACLVDMNCKQLQAYAEDDKPGVCAGAAEAADAVCGGAATCSMGGSAGMNECSVSRECDGVVEELQCDGETCVCVIDGEPGASCADEGVCALALDGQITAAEACCGFAW